MPRATSQPPGEDGPNGAGPRPWRARLVYRAARGVEAINEWVGRAVAWLTAAMVLTTFFIVVLRYGFSLGSLALQESITYMHALVFMLGAGYALKHEAHVRVDIFYRRMSARGRALVNLLGTLLLLMPMVLFIGWESWDYVAASWRLLEGSREPGGLPGVFLLKSVILLMSALLLLQGLAWVARSALVLTGQAEPAEEQPLREL